jgi:hypothetical protein
MAATAAQIAEVRRMVNEPTTSTYSDVLITAIIERYPLLDELGSDPYTWTAANPPVKTANAAWYPTYDLNAAAADIWDEKAAAVAALYDFKADGGDYTRSQMFSMYQKLGSHYRSRRSMKTTKLIKSPEEYQNTVTVNYLPTKRSQ